MTGQPSPYSDKTSAEKLALAGQSGALWRLVKRRQEDASEWRRLYAERRAAAERAGAFHRRAQEAEGEVASLRRQLAHVGREWSEAVEERNARGRTILILGGILQALAERLTPEEAATVVREMARASRR